MVHLPFSHFPVRVLGSLSPYVRRTGRTGVQGPASRFAGPEAFAVAQLNGHAEAAALLERVSG